VGRCAGGRHDIGSQSRPTRIATAVKPWTGDFDRMVERRVIRVLVRYSRTLYCNEKGP